MHIFNDIFSVQVEDNQEKFERLQLELMMVSYERLLIGSLFQIF